MYQLDITSMTHPKESIIFYENLTSAGLPLDAENVDGDPIYIIVEFRGETTNWYRTVCAVNNKFYPNSITERTWDIRFQIYKQNWLGIIDTEYNRRELAEVFLPSPEIYTINFYSSITQAIDVNLAGVTKLPISNRITIIRSAEDNFNDSGQAVSSYTEYTDNDNDINDLYGINS